MGLRERNAARTREHIVDSALELFLERGFDPTTMEEIADRADISASTLYRYFPTKELLVVEPLSVVGHVAATLQERPADEPLAEALGHAIRSLILAPRTDPGREAKLRQVIDGASGPSMRLYGEFVSERTLLERAVAARLGRAPDDIYCVMTARLTMSMVEMISERAYVDRPTEMPEAHRHDLGVARTVLEAVQSEPPTMPLLRQEA